MTLKGEGHNPNILGLIISTSRLHRPALGCNGAPIRDGYFWVK